MFSRIKALLAINAASAARTERITIYETKNTATDSDTTRNFLILISKNAPLF